jgi:hypothetical protein
VNQCPFVGTKAVEIHNPVEPRSAKSGIEKEGAQSEYDNHDGGRPGEKSKRQEQGECKGEEGHRNISPKCCLAEIGRALNTALFPDCEGKPVAGVTIRNAGRIRADEIREQIRQQKSKERYSEDGYDAFCRRVQMV